MAKISRKWSAKQKLAILQEAERDGNAVTCRRHQLANSMIGKWRAKLQQFGEAGLESYSNREPAEQRELADENRRLKQLVADVSLEAQMLRELLKKKDAQFRIKGE
jgi:putative transposase